MALSRRTGRSRLILVLLVLTSVTVLTLDSRGSSVTRALRTGAVTVFSPLRSAAGTVTRPVADAWNGVLNYGDVRRENEDLRRQLDDLRATAARGANDSEELSQLQEQLELSQLRTTPNVTARVVAGPLTNFDHTIELDKGSSAGIRENMAVVAGGLVGRVVQVTGDRASVLLVTDPDFRVGVKLATSQQVGLARGQGDGSPLIVDSLVDPVTQVPPDEVLTTSGQTDSYYPAGIPVGRVTRSELSADRLTLVLTVEPEVDFDRLSYASVLLTRPG